MHSALVLVIAALVAMAQGGAVAMSLPPDRLSNVETVVHLGADPVTLRLAPGGPSGPAAAGAEAAVSIALEGIQGSARQPVRLNVFIGKPDADRTVQASDPHFLGFVQLLPRHGGVIAPTSHRLAIPGGGSCASIPAMLVTIVPVVAAADAPRNSALTIGRVYARCERFPPAAG